MVEKKREKVAAIHYIFLPQFPSVTDWSDVPNRTNIFDALL